MGKTGIQVQPFHKLVDPVRVLVLLAGHGAQFVRIGNQHHLRRALASVRGEFLLQALAVLHG
ncbi:hypothetical protein [Thermomonas sp.]|uniref:hypothetical protein n=1 Tax=Thermomonas sp. TaxID=1971895 RepID=UPI00262F1B47|nr:hypothetical protein [Thermomonas sp.]MCO5054080.1 hypothetical protein [Thermomonas sp.]